MSKRVMIIGAIEAGKSSLVRALFNDEQPARKTQALEYRDWVIDTPGEYSENPMFYRTLMATSLEAGIVVMVQDATRERNYFPPGFSQGFPQECIGVITKIDHPDADLQRAEAYLRQSLGDADIFRTSSHTGDGVPELRAFLQKIIQQ
ncbi:EutP/PduV family microcompartment system protein [Brevibacillus choshinensis]|uniref:EutP/PduV family microcompartment system protein n=1 Tax=Brevibacillus choshinensis TaxID=54911 RepID=UPI002E21A5E5|nr:EutP/PduV family microcompartment system protein [Brevibacillus choshinensis]MED4583698.1 EutP/PduV family microcompartment system protein [Brevibacillus choshinensis]MED4751594.1 EutP/PduV family microcompartment system protein [Brevibacillus choshinensis]MED4780169.1 EutP/PduV family microcompartment system protein [Brevibacillus choshinensis]